MNGYKISYKWLIRRALEIEGKNIRSLWCWIFYETEAPCPVLCKVHEISCSRLAHAHPL